MAASLPPQTITSASPWRMHFDASPIACVAVEQALTGDQFGPRSPSSIET